MHRLCLIVLVASWCAASGLAQEGSGSKPISKPVRDFAVIETVLRDLLSYKKSPLIEKDDPESKIRFSRDVRKSNGSADGVLSKLGYCRLIWNKLSTGTDGSTTEAVEDLFSRREENEPFKGFKPSNSRIVVVDKEKFDPLGPQRFSAEIPGYSKDGSAAIVKMSFSYGEHGGSCTYFVVRFRNAWIVLFCAFIYYA